MCIMLNDHIISCQFLFPHKSQVENFRRPFEKCYMLKATCNKSVAQHVKKSFKDVKMQQAGLKEWHNNHTCSSSTSYIKANNALQKVNPGPNLLDSFEAEIQRSYFYYTTFKL